MNYHKRIVLDFDDTLAFHKNRDFQNAEPNIPLITKTNELYDNGWQIDIFTARGSISCETREDAKNKYLPSIEQWLRKHKVKYHSISFDKPLAAYYVDDKGCSPEEFTKLDIKNLQGGLSGSDIYSDGKLVHKKDTNAHLVNTWYETVKEKVKVPKVERVVGDVITMQYINHDKDYFKNNFHLSLGIIQTTLEKLKTIQVKNDLTFDSYVDRIIKHASDSKVEQFLNWLPYKNDIERTFSHGDFGITNLLFTDTKDLYLIDPIPNVFGCTELDCAKLVASLLVNKYDDYYVKTTATTLKTFNNISDDLFCNLVQSEIIRIYKYHPNKNFILECYNKCS